MSECSFAPEGPLAETAGKGLKNGPGLVALPAKGGIRVEFRPSPELEAALTLVASGVLPSHEAMLDALIQQLIGGAHGPNATVSLSLM